ncbi:MAG: 2Fe-2S iron-sulfur cluster-binding protein [Raoultibacter sp.]
MKVTVQKYDPSVDSQPYEVDFEVAYHKNMTVLEALVAIDDEQEPIVFDYSCRGRTCGRCAMTLNGTPCLACVTLVEESGNNTIAPLGGFPVIRDLIVDKTKVTDRVASIMVRKRAFPLELEEVTAPVDPEIVAKISPLENCARCCVCTSACPAVSEKGLKSYIGPTGMLAIGLRFYDPYDQGDRVVEAVQSGLYDCRQCGTCSSVCKALEIDHLSVWADLRNAAKERNFVPKE